MSGTRVPARVTARSRWVAAARDGDPPRRVLTGGRGPGCQRLSLCCRPGRVAPAGANCRPSLGWLLARGGFAVRSRSGGCTRGPPGRESVRAGDFLFGFCSRAGRRGNGIFPDGGVEPGFGARGKLGGVRHATVGWGRTPLAWQAGSKENFLASFFFLHLLSFFKKKNKKDDE